jgi:predicted nucleic acid-binding protein
LIPYVIDTCALVKLVVPEDYSDTVSAIAELHRASRIQLIAPEFVLLECANVLWKHASRHNAPIADMMSAFEILRRLDVRLIPQDSLIEDALRFALDVGIVVYDAIFCVAAERSRSALITEDTRLINSLAGTEVRTVALQTWVPPA